MSQFKETVTLYPNAYVAYVDQRLIETKYVMLVEHIYGN